MSLHFSLPLTNITYLDFFFFFCLIAFNAATPIGDLLGFLPPFFSALDADVDGLFFVALGFLPRDTDLLAGDLRVAFFAETGVFDVDLV